MMLKWLTSLSSIKNSYNTTAAKTKAGKTLRLLGAAITQLGLKPKVILLAFTLIMQVWVAQS